MYKACSNRTISRLEILYFLSNCRLFIHILIIFSTVVDISNDLLDKLGYVDIELKCVNKEGYCYVEICKIFTNNYFQFYQLDFFTKQLQFIFNHFTKEFYLVTV